MLENICVDWIRHETASSIDTWTKRWGAMLLAPALSTELVQSREKQTNLVIYQDECHQDEGAEGREN